MPKPAVYAILATISAGPAYAHVVEAACCGPQDVHHLKKGAVHIMADGYHIDGIKTVIPVGRAQPSADGDYWAFWNPIGEPEPIIFCFFAPLNGA